MGPGKAEPSLSDITRRMHSEVGMTTGKVLACQSCLGKGYLTRGADHGQQGINVKKTTETCQELL